jgi:hypothetical protein
MKKTKYTVIYLNGNLETFYTVSFTHAIILGMAYAIDKAWDYRIKYISDDKGNSIKNIQAPTYEFSA